MRRSIVTVAFGLLFFMGGVVSPAEADGHGDIASPKVMTLNLYVGADLSSFNPVQILETIEATDFEERAATIAEEIDDRNPDLIGLQEVSDLSVTFGQFGEPVPGEPQLNYLQILLDELAERGEHYFVASEVTNAKVSLPLDPDGFVWGNLIDRDVILAREGTEILSKDSGNYQVNFRVPFPPPPEKPITEIEFTRGWTLVHAKVDGDEFTFVNTHLEVEPNFETFEGICVVDGPIPCQIPQADELVGILSKIDNPTILVGDFNAEPGTVAYDIIADAGFVDAWDIRLFGFIPQQENTCCQAEDLLNPYSQLSQRIDIIFIRVDGEAISLSTVFFDRFWEKTPSGLWPSDHGGVVSTLLYENP
ncbi:MAG: endonuclease/exonuclease/phosphatase family protein [Acidimicrobiia bacterium]|nr:endonuclease/exonuclease/phosphatase family protein [Acidimicrobiia bacterium]